MKFLETFSYLGWDLDIYYQKGQGYEGVNEDLHFLTKAKYKIEVIHLFKQYIDSGRGLENEKPRNNIIKYRDFELEVTLNIEDGLIYGKVLPNEHNFEIHWDYSRSDTFYCLKESFEEQVDKFWNRQEISENAYKYKGVTLEIEKKEVNFVDCSGEAYVGTIKDFPKDLEYVNVFESISKRIEEVKESFEIYVDKLEHYSKIFNHLTKEKTK